MNDRFNKILRYDFSGAGCVLIVIALALIASSIGLGWIVNGVLVLFVLALVAPVLIFWGAQWWLRRNFVQDDCPVCHYQFTGFKNTEFQCPNCNEPLQVTGNSFARITPPGTIDVDAVEVSVQKLEED